MAESVQALMRADAANPVSNDRLAKAQKEVAKLRALTLERESLDEKSKQLGTKIFELRTRTIPDLLDSARIGGITVEAEGNLPRFEVEVADEYKANIPEEYEAKAFDWLREHGHGDLIKGVYTIEFGMGQGNAQAVFENILKRGGYDYSYKFGVPWNTLTAWAKEQIVTRKQRIPMKLLGVTVTRLARLVKEKKSKSTKGKTK